MYVADSGRAVDVILPGQSSKRFLPVVAAFENPFADFIQTHRLGAPEVEQSIHFHREQRDDSVGKILAGDAASVFVVKKRHGEAAFQSSLDKVDGPFFPVWNLPWEGQGGRWRAWAPPQFPSRQADRFGPRH